MPKISDSLTHKNVVCPFCSLHCDDLEINVYDNKLSVKNNIPKSCALKFEQLNLPIFREMPATVKGKHMRNKKHINILGSLSKSQKRRFF
ncbi:MAG: hypothetical protein CM15mP53_06540 [Ectothiorhodospiraceae bacterium]|nr:MAG: hypothetical protein CM15mP53_06540 [Ectothiorhodospiraceae bacterium]